MTLRRRLLDPLTLAAFALMVGAGGVVWAQLEGDRGIPPIDNSSSYEVSGVPVDVSGKTADQARMGGWRLAQRKGWKMLWARVNAQPVASAPSLPDSTLDSIVAGIVVEDEQIGTDRYIAKLGVLFDRVRAGQLLGVQGQGPRSAPMLVIPVLWNGDAPTTFEVRNLWQRAWARYRSGGSPIDYVRVAGTGSDPLLLNLAQTQRPGRAWWRMLLDQYGAADVVVPEVRLTRAWPGGPVTARFLARHGPDSEVIDSFTLHADNSAGLAALMEEGVRRIDDAYTAALRDGRLHPDRSLNVEQAAPVAAEDLVASDDVPVETGPAAEGGTAYTVQVDTPDAASLSAAEQALRSVPGVRSAATTSMALGGVSLMRVAYDGDIEGLRISLAARGWRIEQSGTTLRIRRQAAAAAAPEQPTGGTSPQ